MGLDVFSVRCHRHNVSHSRKTRCALCVQDAREQAAAARASLARERADGAEARLELVGAPSAPRLVPQHVQAALDRFEPSELFALLGELEMWKRARSAGTQLRRWPIQEICIGPCVRIAIRFEVPEPLRLVRLDVQCDEGDEAMRLVHVQRVSVGTRIIAEGGSLAQLNRCPLGREVLTPSVGGQLCVTNASAGQVTVRGAVIGERAPDGSTWYVDEV